MEMPMKWDDFHVIEDEVVVPERKNDRRCPKCNKPVTADQTKSIAHQIAEKEIMNLPETHFVVLQKEEKMLNFLIEL